MPREKSNSLHNFTLPPRLSWGVQRVLPCSNAADKPSAAIDGDRFEGDRFEVMREKMINDLQSDVDKIKNAILVEGGDGDHLSVSIEDPKPWNLRKRKAACQEPTANFGVEEEKPRSTPQRKRFSISLSRQDIKEDLLALNARRKARKPKKRPKTLQHKLNTLFPGYSLSKNIANMYKRVDETVEGQ